MSADRPTTLRESAPGLRRTLRAVRPYLRAERRLLVGGTLALLAEVALRLLEPWPLKVVVDAVVRATREPQPGITRLLALAAVASVLVVAVRSLADYCETVCFSLAGNRVLSRMRTRLYAHLHRLPLAFHEGARTGDLVTRVTGDIGRLQDVAVTAALPLLGNVTTVVAMLGVVVWLDPLLALIVVVVLPLFLVTGARLSRRINEVAKTQRKAEGALASQATESLGAIKVVQAYSLEEQMQEAFGSSAQRSLKDGVRGTRLSAALERKTDVLVGLATGLVLFLGGTRVVSGGLTPGELVVFLTYLKTAFKPMRDVAKYTARIAKAAAAGDRVVDVLETPVDLTDSPTAYEAPAFRGDVRLEAVRLSYVPGHPVLRGVDLHVRPGECVALVGPSGSGKSSLAALLSRLRDPDAGRVLVDGHDLRDLTLASVRRQVAVVLQESVLFAVSIRDNIAHGLPGATLEQVQDAARLAGAHEFIQALPSGYDTVVGERGETLSGGQRQRIAIARAAVRDAPVVVLDEALTGLDTRTEAAVVAALGRLTAGRTTFVITHDLAAARRAERVVRIARGRVVDDGPADAVLDRMRRRPAVRRRSVRVERRAAAG